MASNSTNPSFNRGASLGDLSEFDAQCMGDLHKYSDNHPYISPGDPEVDSHQLAGGELAQVRFQDGDAFKRIIDRYDLESEEVPSELPFQASWSSSTERGEVIIDVEQSKLLSTGGAIGVSISGLRPLVTDVFSEFVGLGDEVVDKSTLAVPLVTAENDVIHTHNQRVDETE